MSYEIIPRASSGLSRSEQRQWSSEMARLDHQADLAEEQVAGINRVAQRAMFETMRTNELRKIAEQIAPGGAELYAMIAVTGAVESARVISRLSEPYQGYR
jgi:hypothetical protein